jgi:hypothetical protein
MIGMERDNRKSYFQLIADIFNSPPHPDYVRISLKEWGVLSLMMSIMMSLPASIIIGIVWLVDPKEDSLFLFMSIPWIFVVPAIFILTYIYNYRKPRRNDAIIKNLFASIEADAPISSESGCSYIMCKDDFVYDLFFDKTPVSLRNGSKRDRSERLVMRMAFDCEYENIQQYLSLAEDMYAYFENKRVGSYITVNYHTLSIKLEIKTMTPEWIMRIVDEFTYLTKRFKLSPITREGYSERMERIKILLAEKNSTSAFNS